MEKLNTYTFSHWTWFSPGTPVNAAICSRSPTNEKKYILEAQRLYDRFPIYNDRFYRWNGTFWGLITESLMSSIDDSTDDEYLFVAPNYGGAVRGYTLFPTVQSAWQLPEMTEDTPIDRSAGTFMVASSTGSGLARGSFLFIGEVTEYTLSSEEIPVISRSTCFVNDYVPGDPINSWTPDMVVDVGNPLSRFDSPSDLWTVPNEVGEIAVIAISPDGETTKFPRDRRIIERAYELTPFNRCVGQATQCGVITIAPNYDTEGTSISFSYPPDSGEVVSMHDHFGPIVTDLESYHQQPRWDQGASGLPAGAYPNRMDFASADYGIATCFPQWQYIDVYAGASTVQYHVFKYRQPSLTSAALFQAKRITIDNS